MRSDAQPGHSLPEIKVLAVLRGNQAVVDTTGFCRVVIRNTDEILAELLPPKYAEIVAETFRETGGGDAVVIPYRAPRRMAQ